MRVPEVQLVEKNKKNMFDKKEEFELSMEENNFEHSAKFSPWYWSVQTSGQLANLACFSDWVRWETVQPSNQHITTQTQFTLVPVHNGSLVSPPSRSCLEPL